MKTKRKTFVKGSQPPINRSENMGHAIKVPHAQGCKHNKRG